MDKLREEFEEACLAIADECESEGYPPDGMYYESRVQMLKLDEHFAPLFEEEEQ